MIFPASYQGALVNVDAGRMALNCISFNAAQGISETGLLDSLGINKGYDYAGGAIANNTTTGTSGGTVAGG